MLPNMTSYWRDVGINKGLQSLFGQSFLKLEDPSSVAELIATTIGASEGIDVKAIEADLAAAGSTKKAIKSASTALAPYLASAALTRKAATVEGTLVTSAGDAVERL